MNGREQVPADEQSGSDGGDVHIDTGGGDATINTGEPKTPVGEDNADAAAETDKPAE